MPEDLEWARLEDAAPLGPWTWPPRHNQQGLVRELQYDIPWFMNDHIVTEDNRTNQGWAHASSLHPPITSEINAYLIGALHRDVRGIDPWWRAQRCFLFGLRRA